MAPIDKLPIELLSLIFEYIVDKRDMIVTLLQICKRWTAALSVVYKHKRQTSLFVFEDLCAMGKLNELQCMQRNFTFSMEEVKKEDLNNAFLISCRKGQLHVMQWLTTTFNITSEDARIKHNYALRCSCAFGHLSIAQWLTITFNLTSDDARDDNCYALRSSCRRGHLQVAQWLTTRFNLTAKDARMHDTLLFCCQRGHLPIVQWLATTFHLTADDVKSCYDYVCTFRRSIAEWLSSQFDLPKRGTLLRKPTIFDR
eukprot:m.72790 g.72790  ORF g.72790 m.72790 type:complete len:256 (-) comp12358_c0_seq2:1796-2563(-)